MIEDLLLINNIQLLKERKTIIYGCRDLVRKSCKLCIRAGFDVFAIYSDGKIEDYELQDINKKERDEIGELEDIFDYNIIIAEEDNDIIDETTQKLQGHLYTYCGLYNAIFANLDNEIVDEKNIRCISDINYSIGIYDFLSRWLKGIRWVNESAIPVLLYSMPKTGTVSMKHSLLKAGIEHTYIHFLNLDTSLMNQFGNYFRSEVDSIGKIVENYTDVRRTYLNMIRNKKIKIITVMREPIARNYSMAFQSIKMWGIGKLAEGKERFQMQDAVIDYIRDCKTSTFDWFEDEICKVFGIDIYKYPFNKERGYQIIQEGNVEIFLYKLEKSAEIENAMKIFLGNDSFELLRMHESSKEEYRFIYDELKEQIHIPQELLDIVYNDERLKHFYTESEIATFYKKWI